MNDAGSSVLLSASQIEERVAALARRLADDIDDGWVVAPILLGGLWFAADLTRALAGFGRHPRFDALWLASYGEARQSAGRCEVVAPFQRPVAGLDVLILDEVFETGLSLAKALELAGAAGARRVRSAVFARKPAPGPRTLEPDYVAWEAPSRFLTGYGMDLAGRRRGLPWIAADDPPPQRGGGGPRSGGGGGGQSAEGARASCPPLPAGAGRAGSPRSGNGGGSPP